MRYWRGRSAIHRTFSRRDFLRTGALGGVGLWAAFSSGCGQSETKQQAKVAPQETGPKRGGTLNVVATFDPQGMDPHTATASSMRDINDFYYNSPMRFKPGETDYVIEPDLAEKWEQPDDVTYVLHLRKGVKWHNLPPVNGRELTAEDVKYSIERIATPKPAFQRSYMFEEVSKIETPDKYTVKLTTKRPFMPMLSYLADRQTKIVAREAVEAKGGELEAIYIGTGPFFVESFVHNVGAKLKKNPDFYVQGRPYLDVVNIPVVADASARLAALRSRELDHSSVSFSDMDALKRNPGDIQFFTIPGYNQDVTNTTSLRLNMSRPPLNDPRVRKAIQLGVDRQKILDAVADGKGMIIGPVARYLKDWALPEAEVAKYLRYDPEQAKKLLAEAGYSNGLKLVCKVSSNRKARPDTAVMVKDQVKAIGIEITVNVMEHSAWLASQVARDYEVMIGATAGEGPDPDYLYNVLHSKGARQFSNYNNPKMDELLEKQRGLFNKEERRKLIQEIQRIALEDVPEVHLFNADGFVAFQPYLKGYEASLDQGFRRCFEYWVDK